MKLLKLNDGNFINLERCKSSKIGKSTYKYECGKSSIVIKYRSYNNHKSFVKKMVSKSFF